MCGICGELQLDPSARVDKARIQAMTAGLIHRGPDDQGYYFSDSESRAESSLQVSPRGARTLSIGLGHTRLKVIDLEGGMQPMTNEDGSIEIIYNGEIYNFMELREKLESRGHVFRTRSDTEVIAFALWDARKQKLMLARDRLGIKPLYWTRQKNRFLFASELNSLIAGMGQLPELDLSGIWSYLALQYVPAPRTIFKGLKKLEPGTFMLVDARGVKNSTYWSLPETGDLISGKDAQHALCELLEDSVKKRLVADVPLGAFLSGGIDSSSVVAMMRRHMPGASEEGGGLKTFSVEFEAQAGADKFNETFYSKLAAGTYGTDHYPLTVSAGEAALSLPEVIGHLGEPVADPACIPTFLVSRLARQHVTVVLTGEGADELFAGYLRYRLGSLAPFYRFFPEPLRRALLSRPIPRRMRKGMMALGEPTPALRHLAWVSVFQRDQLNELMGGMKEAEIWSRELFEKIFNGQGGIYSLDKTLRADLVTWLPDDLLVKVDSMSMAVSLEARVPFLDHRLVELALRMPEREKMLGLKSKRVLKKAMQGIVPREIINRKKAGFTVPLGAWFRRELKELLLDTLSTDRIRSEGIFDQAVVKGLVSEHLEERQDNSQALYSLLLFQMWQDKINKGWA
jgi:asparagine synthase (glutamine-hydrolysing)